MINLLAVCPGYFVLLHCNSAGKIILSAHKEAIATLTKMTFTQILHLYKIGDYCEHEELRQHFLQRQIKLDIFCVFPPRFAEFHDQSLVFLVLYYSDKEILEVKRSRLEVRHTSCWLLPYSGGCFDFFKSSGLNQNLVTHGQGGMPSFCCRVAKACSAGIPSPCSNSSSP